MQNSHDASVILPILIFLVNDVTGATGDVTGLFFHSTCTYELYFQVVEVVTRIVIPNCSQAPLLILLQLYKG